MIKKETSSELENFPAMQYKFNAIWSVHNTGLLGGVQRGQILRKLSQVSAGNLQKLRKPAEAYGNPTEDQEAKLLRKPCGRFCSTHFFLG